jgi:hypothetical protein
MSHHWLAVSKPSCPLLETLVHPLEQSRRHREGIATDPRLNPSPIGEWLKVLRELPRRPHSRPGDRIRARAGFNLGRPSHHVPRGRSCPFQF